MPNTEEEQKNNLQKIFDFIMFGAPDCKFCGKNPVPHFVNWYFESLSILFAPIRRILFHNKISSGLKNITADRFLLRVVLQAGLALGAVKINNDSGKCKVERAKVLWQDAKQKQIQMKEFLLFGRSLDLYEAKWGQKKIFFSGLPRPENYNKGVLEVMDDKVFLKKLFLKNNLPVPRGGSVWNFFQAKKIFEEIQKLSNKKNACVIVKPRAGSRGRHTTTFVASTFELKQAYKIAKQLCFWAVAEEQLYGPVYRATLINFELCGVLRGEAPFVVGDGVSSIAQLIEFKNQQPHPGVKNIVIDKKMEEFVLRGIRARDIELHDANASYYIPKPNEYIQLSEKIGVNYGGISAEETDICHEDNKQLFVRAARLLGDPIVGFDFIIPDITQSWKEQKCGFIEANSLPFINLHHNPLRGTPQNVAGKIWEMVEEEL